MLSIKVLNIVIFMIKSNIKYFKFICKVFYSDEYNFVLYVIFKKYYKNVCYFKWEKVKW